MGRYPTWIYSSACRFSPGPGQDGMPVFVVEHLEEEFFPWCAYEYENMLRILGRPRGDDDGEADAENEGSLDVSRDQSVSQAVPQTTLLLTRFPYTFGAPDELAGLLKTTAQSITELGLPTDRICLLDSEAPCDLSPSDLGAFDYFLFGGILGNVDEFDFDRTAVLRSCGFPRRALGTMQMTTDTAVRVAKMVLVEGRILSEMDFADRPEFPLEDEAVQRSLVMNFRYVSDCKTGRPLICPRVLRLLLDEARDDDLDLALLE